MRKNPISKTEVEKIEYILEDIKNGRLILEHPLQRYSDQWTTEQKSNLIRRALHDGQFLPILICTQYDEYGCEDRYLIDGVQRITTFESYINDVFAISRNTIDFEVAYDGVVYETKDNKSGKFILKRDRKKNLIPVLDEEGNIQRRTQVIDIRGLRYSELPPELQEKLKRYLVTVQLKLECTDEDIQIEILDYNNGTKMNDAQIGKNRLGVEFARIVIELSQHSFIKNKCGFTDDNRKKGIIDRAINESLMLVNFGTENWVSSHKDLCRKLSNWLETEHTDRLREMFNDLDNIIEEDKEIKDYLTLKEFFVAMANYKHFLDTDYKKECYGMFLSSFIKELSLVKNIPTGEVDDDGNDVYGSFKSVYMTGTKQKGSIEERLTKMNEMLDAYLEEHCEGMFEDDEEVEEQGTDTNEMENFINEFIATEIPHNTADTALRAFMQFTKYPTRDFTVDGMMQFKRWLMENKPNSEDLDDCVLSAYNLRDYLNNAGAADKFSANDIAILTYYIYTQGEILNETLFEEWLDVYENDNNCESNGDNQSLLEKETLMASSFATYINNARKGE